MITFYKRMLSNKVVRNFSYLTFGSFISQLIGIFTIIKITRLFSPTDYGTFTFIMSQGTFLYAIADLGITNIIIRTIARNKFRTNDLIFNGAILRFFAVLLLAGMYLFYNFFLGNLSSLQLLLVFLFALINSLVHLFETAFLGNQKMLPTSIINLSYSLIWFCSVYLLPVTHVNVIFLFIIFLLLNSLKAFVSYIVLRFQNLLVGQVRNFWQSCNALLKESWPYFSLVLIMIPVNYLSNNFLELNSKISEVGYFNLSQKLMLPITLVFGFALSAIFPNLSSLWINDEKHFRQIVSVGFKYFIIIAAGLCFLFTLFIKEVVIFLFQASYLPAVQVCQLQVWFEFLMVVSSLIGTILGAINKEKLILKLGIINALIATPMLYWGSKSGAVGLSYGYVISFSIAQIYTWPIFKKVLNIKVRNDGLLWLLVFVLFIISYFIPQNTAIIYRIIPALIIVGAFSIYFLRTMKSVQLQLK